MSIVGPRSGENKAFTRDEKSAATQLVKDRPVPLPEPQTLSSKLRGLAGLQSVTAMKSVRVKASVPTDKRLYF
jgi:hypothetical protein